MLIWKSHYSHVLKRSRGLITMCKNWKCQLLWRGRSLITAARSSSVPLLTFASVHNSGKATREAVCLHIFDKSAVSALRSATAGEKYSTPGVYLELCLREEANSDFSMQMNSANVTTRQYVRTKWRLSCSSPRTNGPACVASAWLNKS